MIGTQINTVQSPVYWANRINKLLNQFHSFHGGIRFPVDVESIGKAIPDLFQTGEPIQIQSQALGDDFEGGLFDLNAGEVAAKPSWALVYNEAIQSEGRKRFTVAHEIGHYLLHRKGQSSFQCSETDMLDWDSEQKRIEAEADKFASYLLMPLDDFRQQVAGANVDLDVLGACAERYGVSLTAAALKWLEFTSTRAILIISSGGSVRWSRGSESGKWLSIYINQKLPNGQKRRLPAQCISMQEGGDNVIRNGATVDAKIWFPNEPQGMTAQEMKIVSDRYKHTMTLLILPNEVKPWERNKQDDDDESTNEDSLLRVKRNFKP